MKPTPTATGGVVMEFTQKRRRIDQVAEVLDGDTPENIEPPDGLQLKVSDWLGRDIPAQEFMLGELLSTTTRCIVIGPTGLGKTKLGLAIAVSIAAEMAFLHWSAPSRVGEWDPEQGEPLQCPSEIVHRTFSRTN
jgi:hypothetical protein